MARIISNPDWTPQPRVRKSKYPWDEWLDGKVRQLIKGDDFYVDIAIMQTSVYNAAYARRMGARTAVISDTILQIQAVK